MQHYSGFQDVEMILYLLIKVFSDCGAKRILAGGKPVIALETGPDIHGSEIDRRQLITDRGK